MPQFIVVNEVGVAQYLTDDSQAEGPPFQVRPLDGSDIQSGDVIDAAGKVTRPASPAPQLDGVALLATVLAVNGTLTLNDAATAAGVPAQALVDEALAWAVGAPE